MSRSEWERGEIKIPSSEWAATKKLIREAWNKEQDRLFARAKTIYEKIKGKKKPQNVRADPFGKDFDNAPCFLFREKEPDERGYWILRETMRRPTRSDFSHVTNRANSFMSEDSDLTVAFDNDKRTILWDVVENEDACEEARRSGFGSAVMRILGQVKYKRGSGGKIIGNDEYNQDTTYEGGGANYVKDEFGPDMPQPERPVVSRGYGPFGFTSSRY